MTIKFEIGKTYVTRRGDVLAFVKKVGSVLAFDTASGDMWAQHESGRYRWDDVDHPRDIVEVEE